MHQWRFLLVAEDRVQKQSLQTAQNLLQEEVARAEEQSEVTTRQKIKKDCSSFSAAAAVDSWKAHSLAGSPPTTMASGPCKTLRNTHTGGNIWGKHAAYQPLLHTGCWTCGPTIRRQMFHAFRELKKSPGTSCCFVLHVSTSHTVKAHHKDVGPLIESSNWLIQETIEKKEAKKPGFLVL